MKLSIICATLFAAAVQARYFILLDAASTRTKVYLFSAVEGEAGPQLIDEVKTPRAGGEQGLHKVIKDDPVKDLEYFKELLMPLAETTEGSLDVYIYGSDGMRGLPVVQQTPIWTKVKTAIENVAFVEADAETILGNIALVEADAETILGNVAPVPKFVVRDAETMDQDVASTLAFQMLGGKSAGLVAIGGESVHAGVESDNASFEDFGSGKAFRVLAGRLVNVNERWSENYENAVRQLKEDVKVKESKDLLVEVGVGGRLVDFAQKIDHPCLMSASQPMDMIAAKSRMKKPDHLYYEVIPFKGTGDYNACFKAIAAQMDEALVVKETIDEVVVEKKRPVPIIPKTYPIVGLGTLFHNQENLKKLDIRTDTVGDVVRAAKTVCGYDFSEKYKDVNRERGDPKRLEISPHGLVELCWVATHDATVLKHLLKLDDKQELKVTDKAWVLGMAQLIATAKEEHFNYQKYKESKQSSSALN